MKTITISNSRVTLLLALPILAAFAAKPVLFFVSTWQEWLAVDYLLRIFFLAYVLMIPTVRLETSRMFCWPWPDSIGPLRWLTFIAVIIAACTSELFINQIRYSIHALFPMAEFFDYFEIENRFWLIFDLTIGLILVAVSEEIMFRGFVIRVLESFTTRPIILVILSAVIFGMVHWTNGVDHIVAAGLTGIILGSIYLWSKSLWPCVIIHYLINLGYFWPS